MQQRSGNEDNTNVFLYSCCQLPGQHVFMKPTASNCCNFFGDDETEGSDKCRKQGNRWAQRHHPTVSNCVQEVANVCASWPSHVGLSCCGDLLKARTLQTHHAHFFHSGRTRSPIECSECCALDVLLVSWQKKPWLGVLKNNESSKYTRQTKPCDRSHYDKLCTSSDTTLFMVSKRT